MINSVIKTPNYTDEMVAIMTEAYNEKPSRETVDALAVKLGRPYRSIIAKLARLGIYKAPERTNKRGGPIVKKDALVADISAHLDGVSIDSLVKANKEDLKRLVSALNEHFGELN